MSTRLTEAQIRSGLRGCCGGPGGPKAFCETWGCAQIGTLLELLDAARDAESKTDKPGHERSRPMTDDHRGLIESAREQDLERRFGSWQDYSPGEGDDPIENIVGDAFALIVRLAEALEGTQANLRHAEQQITDWTHLAGELDAANARAAAAERRAAELEEWRDNVSGALRSWDVFETGEWGGDKDGWGYHFELIRFLVRHYESRKDAAAETAILEYARWVRATFPADLEQSDAEQRLLDLADALADTPGDVLGRTSAGAQTAAAHAEVLGWEGTR